MNIVLKIILYFFSTILIFNILLFLFLVATSYKNNNDSLKKTLQKNYYLMVMGYTYLFLGIHELIFGRKPYQPRGLLT